jgi:hypothetical protein
MNPAALEKAAQTKNTADRSRAFAVFDRCAKKRAQQKSRPSTRTACFGQNNVLSAGDLA